jgi:hypothetical protein
LFLTKCSRSLHSRSSQCSSLLLNSLRSQLHLSSLCSRRQEFSQLLQQRLQEM